MDLRLVFLSEFLNFQKFLSDYNLTLDSLNSETLLKLEDAPAIIRFLADLYVSRSFLQYSTDSTGFWAFMESGCFNKILIVEDSLAVDLVKGGFINILDGDVSVKFRGALQSYRKHLMRYASTWVGSRYESALQRINCVFNQDLMLTNLPDSLDPPKVGYISKYIFKYDPVISRTIDGQKKLWFIENGLHLNHDLSIMVGGSPASRYRDIAIKNAASMLVIDPAPCDSNLTHFPVEYSTSLLNAVFESLSFNSVFISIDVRNDMQTSQLYRQTLPCGPLIDSLLSRTSYKKCVIHDRVCIYQGSSDLVDVQYSDDVETLTFIDKNRYAVCFKNGLIFERTKKQLLEEIVFGKDLKRWRAVILADYDIISTILSDISSLMLKYSRVRFTVLFKLRPVMIKKTYSFALPYDVFIQPYVKDLSMELRGFYTNRLDFALRDVKYKYEWTLAELNVICHSAMMARLRYKSGYDLALERLWSHLTVVTDAGITTNSVALFSLSNYGNTLSLIHNYIASGSVITLPYGMIGDKVIHSMTDKNDYVDHAFTLFDEVKFFGHPVIPLINCMQDVGIYPPFAANVILTVVINQHVNYEQRRFTYSTQYVKIVSHLLRGLNVNYQNMYDLRTIVFRDNLDKYIELIKALSHQERVDIQLTANSRGKYDLYVDGVMTLSSEVSGHLISILIGSFLGMPYGIYRYLREKAHNAMGSVGYEDGEDWKLWHYFLDDYVAVDVFRKICDTLFTEFTYDVDELNYICEVVSKELINLAHECPKYLGLRLMVDNRLDESCSIQLSYDVPSHYMIVYSYNEIVDGLDSCYLLINNDGVDPDYLLLVSDPIIVFIDDYTHGVATSETMILPTYLPIDFDMKACAIDVSTSKTFVKSVKDRIYASELIKEIQLLSHSSEGKSNDIAPLKNDLYLSKNLDTNDGNVHQIIHVLLALRLQSLGVAAVVK